MLSSVATLDTHTSSNGYLITKELIWFVIGGALLYKTSKPWQTLVRIFLYSLKHAPAMMLLNDLSGNSLITAI